MSGVTLEELTAAFLSALRGSGVPYALAGGLAANAWVRKEDVHPTFDVDAAVLVSGTALMGLVARIETAMREAGIPCFHSASLSFRRAAIERFLCADGTVADLLLVRPSYASEAIARAGAVQLGRHRFPVLAPEDVILFKSLARREKDVGPIAALAAAGPLDIAYIERWARSLGTWSFVRRSLGLRRRARASRARPRGRRRPPSER